MMFDHVYPSTIFSLLSVRENVLSFPRFTVLVFDHKYFRYEPENGIKADLLNHSPGALKCDKPFNSTPCNADTAPCLFDIEADPCEYNNLAQRNADVVDFLLDKISEYNATALPSVNIPQDPRAQASVNGGLMRPWIPVVDLVGGVRSLSRGSPFTLFLSSIILRCW